MIYELFSSSTFLPPPKLPSISASISRRFVGVRMVSASVSTPAERGYLTPMTSVESGSRYDSHGHIMNVKSKPHKSFKKPVVNRPTAPASSSEPEIGDDRPAVSPINGSDAEPARVTA